ncbi:MAG: GAF domain-containing protein [Bdellovibrionales bacterium]|nr:GAF domain-containing protein [Bdellovibrionales bacterium]
MNRDFAAKRNQLLARLPLLLNSSLETQTIISAAVRHLAAELSAEAGTVFLADRKTGELTFWALEGGKQELVGKRIGKGKGIVGWVIEHEEAAVVRDTTQDPRFYQNVDRDSAFITKNLICAPLATRGGILGAVQVLNSTAPSGFTEDDRDFLTQAANQLALAIDNARLYETLARQNKQLAALAKKKDEMMSVIAHEFRTPLMLVQSAADLLASGAMQDEESQQKISETLRRGAERVTKLLTNIQSMSLISDRKLAVEAEEFDLPEMIRGVAESRMPGINQRSLFLHLEIEPDIDTVVGDEALLSIVVANLLDNAIRFTPDGGKIVVSARHSAGEIEVGVRDTGIGIEADQIPAIFDKFYEVTDVLNHSSGTYEFKSAGLGLGLATVWAILEAHGTQVKVESTPGKGSYFSFRIPL